MTQSTPNDLTSDDLRALLESIRREQREAIEALQQQHRAEMRALASTMQRQHREEMGTLTATMHGLQGKFGSLKSHPVPTSGGFHHPARESARRHILPLRPFGGRGRRIGVGLGLALLLSLAPSGSGRIYADGAGNTRVGDYALPTTTTGDYNSAFGYYALGSNTSGSNNTADGESALSNNTTGGLNTASGFVALINNSTGADNTASGSYALRSNTTGSYNTAVGYGAGNTDTPANANTTGSNNTFIGYNAGPGVADQLTNATAIGANAIVSQSNSIVLGGTGANTQHIGVGTTTPHSAFQIAKGFLQLRPITGAPAPEQCVSTDDAGRLVVRTDGNINLYVCTGTGGWIGK